MAAPTNYYIDPAGGSDVGGDGSLGNPWASVQHALDTITRDATNGDQINLRDTDDDVLSAALDFSTYGNATIAAPLVIRGYTNAANDGGIGAISGGGSTSLITGNVAQHTYFKELKLHNTGALGIIEYVAANWLVYFFDCEFADGNLGVRTRNVFVTRCWFHDLTSGIRPVVNYFYCMDSFFESCSGYAVHSDGPAGQVERNLISCPSIGGGIFVWGHDYIINQNTIRAAGSTGSGIRFRGGGDSIQRLTNNIIAGFSGAGGVALGGANANDAIRLYANNKFYNNTTDVSFSGDILFDLGGNETLASDPFTDAANDDFSITAELKAAGWPSSFLGSNTLQFLDPGAAQREEAGGLAGPIIGSGIIR